MNSLIAEFMGLRHVSDDKYIKNLRKMKSNGIYFEQGYMTSELRYDTDWNWLMEVFEKITCMYEFQEEYPSNSTFWELYNQVSIECVHEAVVEFIKWYNESKNKL